MADDPEFAVNRIAFRVTDDLDVTQSFDVAALDVHVRSCISQSRDALNYGSLPGYSSVELAHIWNFIEGMRHSHESIRKLLKGEQSAGAVDALAIARLQVENFYTICYLLEAPQHVRLFLKNAWKQKYVRYLLHRAEVGHLPRMKEYYETKAFELLSLAQHESDVSDAERRTIEMDQTGGPFGPKPKPVRFAGFPGPAKVAKIVTLPDLKRLLIRLNAEYEFLCSFAHGSAESAAFRTMADKRSVFGSLFSTSEIAKFYQEQVLEPPVLFSALSCVLAATETAAHFPNQVELRAKLMAAWKFLTAASFMAIAPWEIRAKGVLGVISV